MRKRVGVTLQFLFTVLLSMLVSLKGFWEPASLHPALAAAVQTRKPPAQALTLGAHGQEVARLQKALSSLGYKLVPDGTFGPATREAVRRFQKANRLANDGVAGPATLKAVEQAAAKPKASRVQDGIYIIQKGDTMASVAARLKIPEALLASINNIGPRQSLYVGQALTVPVPTEIRAPAPPAPGQAEKPAALPAQPAQRRFVLTFDDTPDATYFGEVLQCLYSASVQGTFFLTETTIGMMEERVRTAAARGHSVENHGCPADGSSTEEGLAAGIRATRAAIIRVTGVEPRYYRPLSTQIPVDFAALASLAGHRLVMWTNIGRPEDGEALSAARAAIFDGAVLRFALDDPVVVETLPKIIEYARSQGYGIVSLGSL